MEPVKKPAMSLAAVKKVLLDTDSHATLLLFKFHPIESPLNYLHQPVF
jgi:hypothetical protein